MNSLERERYHQLSLPSYSSLHKQESHTQVSTAGDLSAPGHKQPVGATLVHELSEKLPVIAENSSRRKLLLFLLYSSRFMNGNIKEILRYCTRLGMYLLWLNVKMSSTDPWPGYLTANGVLGEWYWESWSMWWRQTSIDSIFWITGRWWKVEHGT